ncbi:MAG: coiled coil domain-containing protein [Pseudomonadota bacterium]
MSALDAYQQKLQAQLNEWKAQAEVLKAKAEGASADMKIELNGHLEQLKGLQAEAQSKFEELRAAGESKVDDIKSTVEGLVGEATSTLKSLVDRLKP